MNQLILTNSIQDYAAQGSRIIQKIVEEALSKRQNCHIALAGGTSPTPIYEALPTIDVNWSQVHFWWSDERYAPLDHQDSNYFLAWPLLNKLSIPSINIHTVNTSVGITTSAQLYQKDILTTIHAFPQFDLIILGIGPDGHTASLFPNTPPGQNQTPELVIPIFDSPKPPPQRITFTFKLINQAKNIIVCVKGKARVDLVRSWLDGNPSSLPFIHINPASGTVHWLLID